MELGDSILVNKRQYGTLWGAVRGMYLAILIYFIGESKFTKGAESSLLVLSLVEECSFYALDNLLRLL